MSNCDGKPMGVKSIDSNDVDVVTWAFWKKRRYIVVMMAFFGFFNVYSLRVNLSVAIVSMTENRTMVSENGSVYYEQEFPWDSRQKGLVLSSFFYGYILTQLLGGYFAAKIGGSRLYGIGIGVTAILTLLAPWAAKHSLAMFVTIRIIEGIFEGVTVPCIHAVWSRWAPPLERSRMSSISMSGCSIGIVVAMALSSIFATHLGWESVFYIFGAVGCVWFVSWMIIVKESPELDSHCSLKEREYIRKHLGTVDQKNIKHPWKKMFTSPPVYAIIAAHFCENWGGYTLLTYLPTFLKDTLSFDLNNSGLLSALPYISTGILMNFSGYLADWFQVKGYLTTTQVRRYFNCSAFVGQIFFMMLAAYLPSQTWSVVYITIAVGVGAFCWSGFGVNHLDIAPQHASVLMGIGNTFASIPGIVSPLITGYIVRNQSSDEWRIVFLLTSAIYLVGCIIYWFFASGELQDWAKTPERIAAEADAKAAIHAKKEVNSYVNKAAELQE